MTRETFTCGVCGGVFEKGQTEEEALREREQNGWGKVECDIVCDDCYTAMMLHADVDRGIIADMTRIITENNAAVLPPLQLTPMSLPNCLRDFRRRWEKEKNHEA